MHKRTTSAQGLTAPNAEVSGEKHPKLTSPNEEAQKSPVVKNGDSD